MENSLSPVACRSVLVIGAARSGKSRYALALAEATAPERLYLATAEAGDAEMAERIDRHRRERGDGWRTREEPLEIAAALRAEARPGRVVLVECLTLWLSNLMLAGRDVEAEISELTDVISGLGGPAALIANEVGAGVVPATPLGRAFRDWHGRLNQQAAAACDAVIAVAAGLPTQLKPALRPDIRLR
ncbi:MAG: bifunctional adenosylcobinamide kinase/adenosylcobinamide-phosphate guanylyltransferase [Roseiarcus sp.]|jgi:adenosylcobinamide kinase/adenosylcobinamide-phosphate guanylyltransferase